jgi:hypothetical protein
MVRETLSEKPEKTVKLVSDSATHKQKTTACLDECAYDESSVYHIRIILNSQF